jgi:hypothetical protein
MEGVYDAILSPWRIADLPLAATAGFCRANQSLLGVDDYTQLFVRGQILVQWNHHILCSVINK